MKELINELEFNIQAIGLSTNPQARDLFVRTAKELIKKIRVEIDDMEYKLKIEFPEGKQKQGSKITF